MPSVPTRFTGKLVKWNAERGFGFLVADHGDQEVFVHISAFPHGGRPPAVGDRLSFEMELDKDGRKRAVKARRPDDPAPRAARSPLREQGRHAASGRASGHSSSNGLGTFLVVALLVAGLGWVGYTRYSERQAAVPAAPQPVMAPVQTTAPVTLPPGFRCDGRKSCSQMHSCREARLFLQHCPGMEMDGDGDGIPCEQQWCTGPLGG